jgi:hypothetical protein
MSDTTKMLLISAASADDTTSLLSVYLVAGVNAAMQGVHQLATILGCTTASSTGATATTQLKVLQLPVPDTNTSK